MVRVSRARFERIVAEALEGIPPDLRGALENIEVVVDDWPTDVHLEEAGLEPGDVLYGLYHGTPLPERSPLLPYTLPDLITIFQGPIEDECETVEEMREEIRRTVLHEVAHYFGFDEERLAELGYD